MSRLKKNYPIFSYPWYIQNWLQSRARCTMTLQERGLFRELIDHCIATGSIPSEPRLLAGICGCSTEEIEQAWPRVSSEFSKKNGTKGVPIAEFINTTAVQVRTKILIKKNANASGGRSKPKKDNEDTEQVDFDSTSESTSLKSEVKPKNKIKNKIKIKKKSKEEDSLARSAQAVSPLEVHRFPESSFDLHSWFEERMRKHPKPAKRTIAFQYIAERVNGNRNFGHLEFSAAHDEWIRYWEATRKQEYAPNMADFILDRWDEKPPPWPGESDSKMPFESDEERRAKEAKWREEINATRAKKSTEDDE